MIDVGRAQSPSIHSRQQCQEGTRNKRPCLSRKHQCSGHQTCHHRRPSSNPDDLNAHTITLLATTNMVTQNASHVEDQPTTPTSPTPMAPGVLDSSMLTHREHPTSPSSDHHPTSPVHDQILETPNLNDPPPPYPSPRRQRRRRHTHLRSDSGLSDAYGDDHTSLTFPGASSGISGDADERTPLLAPSISRRMSGSAASVASAAPSLARSIASLFTE
jgi:hypothetical protein